MNIMDAMQNHNAYLFKCGIGYNWTIW